MTAAARRRALATALWLAAATLLGGLDLPAQGYAAFRFAPFGMVAGLLGILYVFVLYNRSVLTRFPGWLNVLLLVYWAAATATAFRVLLPPPDRSYADPFVVARDMARQLDLLGREHPAHHDGADDADGQGDELRRHGQNGRLDLFFAVRTVAARNDVLGGDRLDVLGQINNDAGAGARFDGMQ